MAMWLINVNDGNKQHNGNANNGEAIHEILDPYGWLSANSVIYNVIIFSQLIL